MKREQFSTAIAVVFIAAVAASGAWLDLSVPQLPKAARSDAGADKRASNEHESTGPATSPKTKFGRQSGNDRIGNSDVTLTNWVQAISASISAAFAIAIWFVYRQQRDISYAQLRPYVFVTAAEVIAANEGGMIITGPTGAPLPIGAGFRPASRLQIHNTGQTPAYETQVCGGLALFSWPLREEDFRPLNFADENITKATIGPNNHNFKWDIIGALDQAAFEALSAFPAPTARAVVAYGEIRYRDVFKREWTTKYRYFTGGPTGVRGTSMAAHQEGNEAT